ncbi:MAG TPA: hypothetical protein VEL12_03780 [Candidatus Nitrosopolaris sp.]|nr:hypothetical protein [Candidatus Nitrosopolaris sp.]
MKIDSEWARTGRAFAWAYGGLLIVAGVLVTVVSVGIPPTAPDLAKHYAYIRQIWPELYISFLLFIAAFASLIAIGVVLREFFGRDIRSELMYASFLAAGVVGMVWMLSQIGSAQVVARDSAGMSPQDLNILGTSSSIWSGVINWLQRGYLLFASLGTLWTGRIVLRQRSLPVGLGWLSIALAVFYWLGLANLLLVDAGVSFASELGSLLVAIGAVLALAWSGWLGWAIGRSGGQFRTSTPMQ